MFSFQFFEETQKCVQIKATEWYFPMVFFLFFFWKVIPTFESVLAALTCRSGTFLFLDTLLTIPV